MQVKFAYAVFDAAEVVPLEADSNSATDMSVAAAEVRPLNRCGAHTGHDNENRMPVVAGETGMRTVVATRIMRRSGGMRIAALACIGTQIAHRYSDNRAVARTAMRAAHAAPVPGCSRTRSAHVRAGGDANACADSRGTSRMSATMPAVGHARVTDRMDCGGSGATGEGAIARGRLRDRRGMVVPGTVAL
ncbi:hypothetical protein [Burkholderia sp. WAC0059]|uniref:hypothetical protein n=1 Tax=Burkholderia sp. WAC0059 TaxID=2066022 RepID=UPI0011AF9F7B|nr:hypothetical protein [Burkholderia sp. WAC0059]